MKIYYNDNGDVPIRMFLIDETKTHINITTSYIAEIFSVIDHDREFWNKDELTSIAFATDDFEKEIQVTEEAYKIDTVPYWNAKNAAYNRYYDALSSICSEHSRKQEEMYNELKKSFEELGTACLEINSAVKLSHLLRDLRAIGSKLNEFPNTIRENKNWEKAAIDFGGIMLSRI